MDTVRLSLKATGPKDQEVTISDGRIIEGVTSATVIVKPGDLPRLIIELIDFDSDVRRLPDG